MFFPLGALVDPFADQRDLVVGQRFGVMIALGRRHHVTRVVGRDPFDQFRGSRIAGDDDAVAVLGHAEGRFAVDERDAGAFLDAAVATDTRGVEDRPDRFVIGNLVTRPRPAA